MRISLPLQLICIIIGVGLFGGFLPEFFIRVAFTVSLLFKEFLSFILPAIVFLFVITGILSFKKRAPFVLAILLTMIFASNALASLVSYSLMWLACPLIRCSVLSSITATAVELQPYFTVQLPVFVRSEHALLFALISGVALTFFEMPNLQRGLFRLKDAFADFINWFIISLLPIYVLGFLLKIRHEGTLFVLMQEYGGTMLLIVCVQFFYLGWVYLVASGFSPSRAVQTIHTALPSYLTAFSSMSSTATLPVSIDSATKNTGDRALAELAMPIMANIHLLGDSISTPMLAMMTLLLFKGALPTLLVYMAFVFYFCTSMFAVSGIPGGGIIVMIPVLTTQLGFTPEMVSIITALYLLMDPFGTAANVMGDGALTILAHTVLKRLGLR